MIEKIEIFSEDKLIEFEITSFDLFVKTEIQLGEIYFLTEIKISGKPFSAELLKMYNSSTSSIKVKITETYKKMKSEIIVDNLFMSNMHRYPSEDYLEFTLKQKWE